MNTRFAGDGSVVSVPEFNFDTDPDAVNVVLQRALCPLTVVTWEATVDSPLHWVMPSTSPKFLTEILRATGSTGKLV